MTTKHVMRIVANNNSNTYWTAWLDTDRIKAVTSYAEAVDRARRHGYDLQIQPEAYQEMVAAGVGEADTQQSVS